MTRIRPGGRRPGPRDPRSRGWLPALAWIALAAATIACASGPANQIGKGDEGAPNVRRILLCPLNLVIGLRSEIQSGAQPVDRELVDYLELQGRTLERIGFIEGRQQWKQSINDAKAAGLTTSAAGLFVARLAKRHEFDAVVMPSLILVQTQAFEGEASWDGVSRKMRVINAPLKGVGRDDSTLVKGIAYGGVSGQVWVASLHVLVFARDGHKVFEGRGGIDFAQQADLINGGKSWRWELRANDAIFDDRALVQEGVERAFEPYLVPPAE